MSAVRLRIENVWTYVEGYFNSGTKSEVDFKLSYLLPDSEFAIRGWEAKKRKELIAKYGKDKGSTMPLPYKWDGRFRFFEGKNHRFPTGFFSDVRNIMIKNGQEYSVVDLRGTASPSLDLKLYGLIPYPEQIEVKNKAIATQRGIIQQPTGSGKTEIIAMILAELNRPAIVLIHRETIFRQLVKRLSERLGTKVGMVGAGENLRKPITVAMTQTIQDKKFLPWLQTFPVVVADECHHVPADTIYEIMQNLSQAYYRLGFSATPWREDGKEMFLKAAFGGFVCQKSPTDLIYTGRLTVPHVFFLDVEHDHNADSLSWQNQYTKTIVNGHHRNRLVVSAAYMFWKKKKTSLIAVTHIKHGELLLKMMKQAYPGIKAVFIQGEDDSDEKQHTLKKLDDRKIDVVIATSVFGEGIDVPSLDVIINAKGQDSKIDVFQLIGRAIRKTSTKKRAYFIDFLDKNYYTKPHSMNRFNILKAERAYKVKKIADVDELAQDIEKIESNDDDQPL
jgi:superfamily II DNA or RNA helicase